MCTLAENVHADNEPDSSPKIVFSHPEYIDHAEEGYTLEYESSIDHNSTAEHDLVEKASFPMKLHMLLENAEDNGQASIIGWLWHGRAFKLYDRKKFEEVVLPLHFTGQKKFASFQRQLNMYGFLRLTGPHSDQKAYYHVRFLRGRSEMCKLVPRCRMTRSTVRRTYDPTTEPKFDAMPPVLAVPRRASGSRYVDESNTATMINTTVQYTPMQQLQATLAMAALFLAHSSAPTFETTETPPASTSMGVSGFLLKRIAPVHPLNKTPSLSDVGNVHGIPSNTTVDGVDKSTSEPTFYESGNKSVFQDSIESLRNYHFRESFPLHQGTSSEELQCLGFPAEIPSSTALDPIAAIADDDSVQSQLMFENSLSDMVGWLEDVDLDSVPDDDISETNTTDWLEHVDPNTFWY